MAKFNYRNALDKRNQYPLLGRMNKYKINGKVYSGDMWINTILEEKPDTVILVVPKNIMLLQAYKKMREELFSIYYVKDEITMLQLKLEKAKNRMAHIIEEGGI